ncbi:MAG: hypothetical protein WCL34_09220 [Methylococcaceae bacterium]
MPTKLTLILPRNGVYLISGFNAGGSGGFITNQDQIRVHGAGLTFADNVTVASFYGITFVSFKGSGAPTTTIALIGVDVNNVTAADFVFN